METSLHEQLKQLYAGEDNDTEVNLGPYRIDAIRNHELIEIQLGSLAAIRDKIAALVDRYQVRVVKPIVARKQLVKCAAKGQRVQERRLSPKRGALLDIFSELVYFCQVFPHRNLTLEVPLIAIEEWRYPGHGRRRRHRDRDHQVEDQKLLELLETHQFQTAKDLLGLLPPDLPRHFETIDLTTRLDISRSTARQMAYCLRQVAAIEQVGKNGNAIVYEVKEGRRKRRRAA